MGHQLPNICLPGMAAAIREQADAVALHHGEDLAGELLRPLGSIDAAAGRMESQAPLFRGSAADPQFSLF